jgi:hypothetical protein
MQPIAREHTVQTPMHDNANATDRLTTAADVVELEAHVADESVDDVERDDLYAEDVDVIVHDDDGDGEFDESLDDD